MHEENPALTVPRWALFVVDVWLATRSQGARGPLGMRGADVWPTPGGWQDQPAALMDAFAVLDAAMEDG